jgi:hypothetical protein
MKRATLCLALVCAAGLGRGWAADAAVAAALATSAAKLNADGKPEKAKSLCYKALAHDEACPVALYELATIFEKEGNNGAAATFFAQAVQHLGRAEASAETTRRLNDAKRRLQALNPFAGRLAALAEEYADEMNGILKKSPDTLTNQEIGARLAGMRLDRFVSADKLPRVSVPATAAAGGAGEPGTSKRTLSGSGKSSSSSRRPAEPKVVAVAPPDVERALRAAGWANITGTWRLVKPNIYEVTDGLLESTKTNAQVSVLVHKGTTGTVGLYARYNPKERGRRSYYYYSDDQPDLPCVGPGYGLLLKPSAWVYYIPSDYYSSTSDLVPSRERVNPLPDFPRHALTIQAVNLPNGLRMEIYLNGKRERLFNYRVSWEGPYAIEVKGTATIELPQIVGQ